MDSASSASADNNMCMPPPPSRPPKCSQPISQCGPRSGLDQILPSPPEMVLSPENSSVGTLLPEGPSNNNREESLKFDNEDDSSIKSESDTKPNDLYSIPSWSAAPAFPFSLEIIKDGIIIDTLSVSSKGAYMFGRSDRCDFILEHLSVSRYHAVLQFKRNGDAYIFDLGSTHGTFVNKKQVLGKTYAPLHVGDVFRFGLSSRLYVLQGPTELMPKESLTQSERQALWQVQSLNEQADQDASLLRAQREAMQTEGATWGMTEDAFEDNSKEEDEVTWQSYKGQLSEKQQKTLEKIQKRNEKLGRLKKEIDSIQVKEIPQGGLTQGQQTQIMRNEQRIEQLMEELDNLEETLNQSIQESIGAKAKRGFLGMKEDENENEQSDDDEFYDRTKCESKKCSKAETTAPVVETANSLLEKREKLIADIETLSVRLEAEETKCPTGNRIGQEQTIVDSQDPLDAFMTTVSSKLVRDHASDIRKEREEQVIELDRINFLLNIADPTGDASRNGHLKQPSKPVQTVKQAAEQMPKGALNPKVGHTQHDTSGNTKTEVDCGDKTLSASSHIDGQMNEGEPKVTKGIWLGHARKNTFEKANATDVDENCNDKDFLEYKERHKGNLRPKQNDRVQAIPEGAGGLILRTPKNVSKEEKHWKSQEDERSNGERASTDTVTGAMQLRDQKEVAGTEQRMQDVQDDMIPNTTKRRKLGPEKPAFLNVEEEGVFQSWLPPEGQTGDGRTVLNEKYGY